MKYPQRSQYKHAKSRYRVSNWAETEAGLQRRGDLTVWLSDTVLDAWRAPSSGKPGGQRMYADIAIEAALMIRMVFHLPLRQTAGFLRSLAKLLGVDLAIPDHTTLSRHVKTLDSHRVRRLRPARPIHLLIDSTGLGVQVGHLRKPPKNRAWRKLHLAGDADTGEILASDLTARRTHDATQVPALLGQIGESLASVSADGADDTKSVYEAVHRYTSGARRDRGVLSNASHIAPSTRAGMATGETYSEGKPSRATLRETFALAFDWLVARDDVDADRIMPSEGQWAGPLPALSLWIAQPAPWLSSPRSAPRRRSHKRARPRVPGS